MTKRFKTRDMAKELFIDPGKTRFQETFPAPCEDPVRFFLELNRYAFFLIFTERFEEAERILELAGRVGLPFGYRSLYKILWLNLGVSVEHQGRYEEAAQYYVKASCRTGKRYGAVKFLERLLARCPSLKRIPEVSTWLRTYRKQEFDQYSLDFNA